MIEYLKADNYKSLVNFKIDFSKINILLGSNGSGKSTIFFLIYSLRAFIRGDKKLENLFDFSTLTRWQTVNIQTFELKITGKKQSFIYQLEIEYNRDIKKNKVRREAVLCNDKFIFKSENGKATLYNDSFEEGPEILTNWSYSGVSAVFERNDNKLLAFFKDAVNRIVVCEPVPMLVDGSAEEADPYPEFALDNLPAVYLSVVQKNPEKLSKLWTMMKEINPSFERTYLEGESEKKLCFEYENNKVKQRYLLSELSEGEKALFSFYFLVINFMGDGYTLMLDEPDNYISLREIIPAMQAVEDATGNVDTQCVLISHHPKVIDYYAQSGGIWLSRYSYGATTVTDAPKTGNVLTYSELISRGDINEAQ